MSGRVIAALGVAVLAAFGGGYALAASGDDEQPAPAAAPKALDLPATSVSPPPARSADALPEMIAPPRAPRPTATTQPQVPTQVPTQPPAPPPPPDDDIIQE